MRNKEDLIKETKQIRQQLVDYENEFKTKQRDFFAKYNKEIREIIEKNIDMNIEADIGRGNTTISYFDIHDYLVDFLFEKNESEDFLEDNYYENIVDSVLMIYVGEEYKIDTWCEETSIGMNRKATITWYE